MARDWQAVANAVTDRLAELDMTQRELSERSGLSVTTIRQIQNNYAPRNRSSRTLADLSTALRWPANYLEQVLDGAPTTGGDDSLRSTVDRLSGEVADLRTRLDAVETALGVVERQT